jgi:hypothetical protein
MWEFQIEPLAAEELPFHLLDSLKGVFESSDPLLRKAAESHRNHLTRHLESIRNLDCPKLLGECDEWIELFKSRHRIRQQLDAQRYLTVARQIGRYQEARILLNASFFSLMAISLFATGSSRDEVVNLLGGQGWTIKHDVLTRWGWIKCHHDLLRDGKKLSTPYSCSLPLRGEASDQDDEEFHQLLFFLHLLKLATGRELLFVEKRQTPDFKLKEKSGYHVGAEMTEAWTSPAWTNEFIASAQIMRFLDQRLQELGVPIHVHIEIPRSWRALRKRQTEAADWIIGKIIEVGIPTGKVEIFYNPGLTLKVKISPTEQRPSISYGSFASSGPKLFDTSKQSDAMRVSLQKIITKKLRTPPPAVKPCVLIIHPVHDLDVDLERVIDEFYQHPKPDVSSHFSEVWFASERHAFQLI